MKFARNTLAGLTLTVATATLSAGAYADPVEDAGQAIAALQAAGYATVRDIELDDGLWEAEVKAADGYWHDVHIDPASGAVIDRKSEGVLLTAAEVTKRIEAAGYSRVHDLDLDEAVWDADATDAQGQRVELRVHGFTGAILASGLDD